MHKKKRKSILYLFSLAVTVDPPDKDITFKYAEPRVDRFRGSGRLPTQGRKDRPARGLMKTVKKEEKEDGVKT